jgi:hypothetical protein
VQGRGNGVPFMEHVMILIAGDHKDIYVSFLKFSLGSSKLLKKGWVLI